MATYRMEDGTIVKTENATDNWDESGDWDGRNHISRATGSQWDHERLYRSRKGRYWIEHKSDRQGNMPWAEWVSHEAAASWLQLMDHELPDDVKEAAEKITE